MKKLFLIPALFIVFSAHAQTKQYIRIETTHFTKERDIKSKTIKYDGGTVDIGINSFTIDKEAPKPVYYAIAKKGKIEPQDEGYTATEYLCIAEDNKGRVKAVKVVLFYTPKRELCDLVVKEGSKNTDYCITDK
jgi:hypothetical protein